MKTKMKNKIERYFKNIIFPCFFISAIVGIITGVVIFLFKICSSYIIDLSKDLYSYVRSHPIWIPALVLFAILLGVISALILKFAKDSRGGGIPTAVVAIRGFVPLKWIQGIFVVFASSMITYLGGVPLGNEGPSVQMGTAVGKGTVDLTCKKKLALDRYGMTGGACAGFAAALRAPLTGIVFALEEAHRRFSPTIFIVAAVSVVTGSFTQECLSRVFGFDIAFFHFKINDVLPLRYMWAAVLVGAVCGILAIISTRFYKAVKEFRQNRLAKIPFFSFVIIIFGIVALLGFVSEDFVGSGHSLIDKIIHGEAVWYLMLLALFIRFLIMILANSEGVTGGLFVPTLAFGAIIASLVSDILIKTGAVSEKYLPLLIVIGMSSFLASSSRTPITAITFAAEALCGVGNILTVAVGVIVAYIIIELSDTPAYTETVIESKIHSAHKGKKSHVINATMVVAEDSFAVGKEIRDILWPPNCVVLSIDKNDSSIAQNFSGINGGDVLHIHYQTYDPEQTLNQLTEIVGEQNGL